MKRDNDDSIPIESLREEYNAPPETPRSEIWQAIETTLEDAPPEELLAAMREAYNPAPPAPRKEMWAVIGGRLSVGAAEAVDSRADRADRAVEVVSLGRARRERTLRTPMWSHRASLLAAAAAALLIMGVGLGRLSVAPEDVPMAGVESDVGSAGTASFRVAAVAHLSRAESLLTMVSSDARVGRADAEVGQWGRALLLQTRLLIDSPASEDPLMLALLEDLEVILIQVARLSSSQFDDGTSVSELELITEGLTDNNMMLRIRSVLPDGFIQAGI